MTWVTWRQHRAELVTLGLLVAAIAVALLALGLRMHALFPDGAAACVGADSDACTTAIRRLNDEHGYASKMLSLFNLLPFVIGAFLGAPLLARELESGTWQLAWTQAVPRMRWLAVKLVALGGLSALLAVAATAAVTWYRRPLDVLNGRFTTDAFDLEGLVPAAYALFAFAAAAAAGAMLKRGLPALAAALGAYLTVRVTVALLRPNFQSPRTLTEPVAAGNTALDPGSPRMATGNGLDWTLASGYADAGGRHLTVIEAVQMDEAARKSGVDFGTYLHEQGIQQWVTYHPADRFWVFQGIEAAIFTGLAAGLLAVVVWKVRRRTL